MSASGRIGLLLADALLCPSDNQLFVQRRAADLEMVNLSREPAKRPARGTSDTQSVLGV